MGTSYVGSSYGYRYMYGRGTANSGATGIGLFNYLILHPYG